MCSEAVLAMRFIQAFLFLLAAKTTSVFANSAIVSVRTALLVMMVAIPQSIWWAVAMHQQRKHILGHNRKYPRNISRLYFIRVADSRRRRAEVVSSCG